MWYTRDMTNPIADTKHDDARLAVETAHRAIDALTIAAYAHGQTAHPVTPIAGTYCAAAWADVDAALAALVGAARSAGWSTADRWGSPV